jgi:hypothetical protein
LPKSHTASALVRRCRFVASLYNRNSVVILSSDDGFILSLVKSLRSLHMAAGAVVMYEGEIADEM